ncbi:DctP family TRAP transporter solute-binding subunit [Shouchella shacheensis]|uniref:DctP family TRAP transporter solute-binding subunit n=1 Tax=Shouchella shacheensis TaxID=1649580 RepID=UPI00073FB705|nr:DctP family TRAP transporter solute-binding subunit [Shouchella shacheensis]
MRKKAIGLLLTSSVLAVSGCSSMSSEASEDDEKVMRLAVATSEERSLTQGLYKFEEIVERETEGDVQVEVFASGQLGGDREVFEGLQLNTIQGTTISTGPVAQFAERFEVFDLPFLFEDEESAYEVLDGSIGDDLLMDLPDQNVIGLNYWENGFRQLTNNAREVNSVEDVSGLDVRTLENSLHMDLWRALGANPTPINYTELYVSLEQGTVNGQENPVGNVTNDRFYEVQQYITRTDHIYNASVFMISKPFWDSLTAEEQEIMTAAADEARDHQRELNRQESEEGYGFIEAEGMTVTELSEEERQEFIDATRAVIDNYTKANGDELVNEILEASEEHNETNEGKVTP